MSGRVALAVALLSGAAAAQSVALRDPTEPPSAFGSRAGSPSNPLDTFKPEHVITVEGQRYVVWKGRRYGVGDGLLGARIERLDETEIWLRTDGGVRKLPLFAGVEKNPPSAGAEKGQARSGAARATAPPGAAKGRTE